MALCVSTDLSYVGYHHDIAMQINWDTLAAWVQAIGSIIAIFVAIWIPYSLDERNKKQIAADKEVRSRIIQASLLPNLYHIRSTTEEFLEENSGQPSFLGVDREPESFDSNFFRLAPEFANVVTIALDSGEIESDVTTLSVLLCKAQEMLSMCSKLQRNGYHAAWINNKSLFIETAKEINILSDKIIKQIENMHVNGSAV